MANENLQNALEQAGLTLEAFAEVIKVDPKSVGRWVNGNTIPYPRHRKAIARALDLDEHELWPGHAPAPEPDTDTNAAYGRCDAVGSFAYADQDTAPDLALLITDSPGPIDILDSYCGIELTPELTDRLAAQAAAGRQIRILTDTPAEQLGMLLGKQQVEVRVDEIWIEFWFIRTGERMLFAINFQDDIAAFPPPVLELTGTVTGGLFDRAQSKFEELWQHAQENPHTLITTQEQLNQLLSGGSSSDGNAVDEAARPGSDGGAAAGSGPSGPPSASPSAAQPGEPAAPQQRRWPGRRD